MSSSLPVAGTGAIAPHAVLLDMDGTLVDTEGAWWRAELRVFRELGYELAQHHREIVVGGPMVRSAGYLIEVTGATISLEELVPRLNTAFEEEIEQGVNPLPGAVRLLAELAEHRVPTALVSASDRRLVDRIAAALGSHRFHRTVAGDELANNKPHPEPYLTAAAQLGVAPAECVAVEDTATGIAAAEAAGCQVVAVPSVAPIAPAVRRAVVSSLHEITLAWLRGLWPAAAPAPSPVSQPAPAPAVLATAADYWPGRTSPLS